MRVGRMCGICQPLSVIVVPNKYQCDALATILEQIKNRKRTDREQIENPSFGRLVLPDCRPCVLRGYLEGVRRVRYMFRPMFALCSSFKGVGGLVS